MLSFISNEGKRLSNIMMETKTISACFINIHVLPWTQNPLNPFPFSFLLIFHLTEHHCHIPITTSSQRQRSRKVPEDSKTLKPAESRGNTLCLELLGNPSFL